MNLDNIEEQNAEFLLKFYAKMQKELKSKIIQAALKNRSKDYFLQLQLEVNREIAKLEAKFKYYSTESAVSAYKSGVEKTEKELSKLNIDYKPLKLGAYSNFGSIHKEAVKVVAENTYQSLSKISKLIGRDVNEYLQRPNFQNAQSILKALGEFVDSETMRKVGLENVRGVVVGSESWQQGILRIEKAFAKQDIFKVPYYSKKTGDIVRMVSAKEYAEVVSINTTAQAHRVGTANRILEAFNGEDLVEIVGPRDGRNRDACEHAIGHIYSLEGKTKGYPLISEYISAGGFGINCRHDYSVTFNVINKYEKVESGTSTQKPDKTIIENPIIYGKMVKGKYSLASVENLKQISTMFSKSDYQPTGHAIQRIYERSSPENVLDTIKAGQLFFDKQGNKTFYKNRLSVHISKETGLIKTIVPRGKKFNPQKKWDLYEKQ